jgi:hypothetical protein
MEWKWFTMKEMTRSQTAEKYNLDNTPGNWETENLNKLVKNILDPLREAWGSPIRVTSGYRCYTLNQLVGGAKKSQHLSGKAADIQPIGRSFDEFKRFLLGWLKDKQFDQCIIEMSKTSRWIHISYDETRNRRKIFTMLL